jgi:hypothetical protein
MNLEAYENDLEIQKGVVIMKDQNQMPESMKRAREAQNKQREEMKYL